MFFIIGLDIHQNYIRGRRLKKYIRTKGKMMCVSPAAMGKGSKNL